MKDITITIRVPDSVDEFHINLLKRTPEIVLARGCNEHDFSLLILAPNKAKMMNQEAGQCMVNHFIAIVERMTHTTVIDVRNAPKQSDANLN